MNGVLQCLRHLPAVVQTLAGEHWPLVQLTGGDAATLRDALRALEVSDESGPEHRTALLLARTQLRDREEIELALKLADALRHDLDRSITVPTRLHQCIVLLGLEPYRHDLQDALEFLVKLLEKTAPAFAKLNDNDALGLLERLIPRGTGVYLTLPEVQFFLFEPGAIFTFVV